MKRETGENCSIQNWKSIFTVCDAGYLLRARKSFLTSIGLISLRSAKLSIELNYLDILKSHFLMQKDCKKKTFNHHLSPLKSISVSIQVGMFPEKLPLKSSWPKFPPFKSFKEAQRLLPPPPIAMTLYVLVFVVTQTRNYPISGCGSNDPITEYDPISYYVVVSAEETLVTWYKTQSERRKEVNVER